MTTAQARAARLLSRSRVTTTKPCAWCSQPFVGITAARFCPRPATCRQKAWQAAQNEGRAAQLARIYQEVGITTDPSDSTLTRSESTPEGTP